jgi:hypothetical protein
MAKRGHRVEGAQDGAGVTAAAAEPSADGNFFGDFDGEGVGPARRIRESDGRTIREIFFDRTEVGALAVQEAAAAADANHDLVGEIDSRENRFDGVVTALFAREDLEAKIDLRLRCESHLRHWPRCS